MQKSNDTEYSYFQIQGIWGVTKHFGGVRISQHLAQLCHIQRDSRVLEVGCGTGITSCRLAEETGACVVGIDLSEDMVAWAQRRVERKRLQDRVQIRRADAQELPFEDGTFDAMLCESVTAFVPDKLRALSEYRRVVRPGGYAGLNEGTWVIGEPPAEFLVYIQQAMANPEFQTPEGWKSLLEQVGFKAVQAEVHKIDALQQRRDEMQGLDWQDYKDRFRAVGTMTSLLIKDPRFRRYFREIMPSRANIRNMFKYLGYGLYIGEV